MSNNFSDFCYSWNAALLAQWNGSKDYELILFDENEKYTIA